MKIRTDKAQSHTTIRDIDISFENDTDDEIDTSAMEEEWIEYMKRNTDGK